MERESRQDYASTQPGLAAAIVSLISAVSAVDVSVRQLARWTKMEIETRSEIGLEIDMIATRIANAIVILTGGTVNATGTGKGTGTGTGTGIDIVEMIRIGIGKVGKTET